MEMHEFAAMPVQQQSDYLYAEGIFLGKKKEKEKIAMLFQVEGYYVEVIYKSFRYHIEAVRCFTTTSYLDPYLEDINIEELNIYC